VFIFVGPLDDAVGNCICEGSTGSWAEPRRANKFLTAMSLLNAVVVFISGSH